MLIPHEDLTASLALGRREHLALVGGGGKTTLLCALAEEGLRAGRRVLSSTTTKVWQREARKAPGLVLKGDDPAWEDTLVTGLGRGGHVFLAEDLLDSGKVSGIAPRLADALFSRDAADWLLMEADGAASRPVKVPEGDEPVIPRSVTRVVAVMGIDALGQPFSSETVFREKRFERLTDCHKGQPLTEAVLSSVFHHPEGLFKGAPDGAERSVFLNRLDLLSDPVGAENLARRILVTPGSLITRVVIGSLRTGRYFFVEASNGRHLSKNP